MNWLGLIAGAGVGRWLALGLAVGAGVCGYAIGSRTQRADTEHVMRLWAEDRARVAEESLQEYETTAANERRVRARVLAEFEQGRIDDVAKSDDVRALAASVRLCALSAEAAGRAAAAAGIAAQGAHGESRSAVELLQELAVSRFAECDSTGRRLNALIDYGAEAYGWQVPSP